LSGWMKLYHFLYERMFNPDIGLFWNVFYRSTMAKLKPKGIWGRVGGF
jgi:hypothetical protein